MTLFDQSIDRRNKTPFYVQLANLLRETIESGEFDRGDSLPPERELESSFMVSRNTVRQAITILENEGHVHRIRGSGTFVTQANPNPNVRIDAFIEHKGVLRLLGYEPTYKQLSTEIKNADELISRKLVLKEGEKVYFQRSITFADGQPAIIGESYIGSSRTGGIEPAWDPTNKAFFDFLEKVVGDIVTSVDIDIMPVVAEGELCALFDKPKFSPLLLLESTVIGLNDPKPISFGRNYYNPEIVKFSALRI
jgi:GntR family transcriptional regulator